MIAVTGANGLLGSFIVRKLREKNLPVTAVTRKNSDRELLTGVDDGIVWKDADVLDFPALMNALEGAQAVIHTAAMVSFNPRKAKKILEVNVEGTRNVVDACLSLKIPKLIHVSSVAALGRVKGAGESDEESKWTESEMNSHYGESKYLAELELYRGKEEGLSISMVNPSVILAPADWNKSSAQIFRYVWDQKMFYTDGALNCVDVRDVVEIIMLLLERDFNGQKFIANGSAVPFKIFFEMVAKRFRKRAPSVRAGEPWTGLIGWLEEVRSLLTGSEPVITRQTAKMARESFVYRNDKAKEVLGIKFRSLEETLDWCCAEYLRKINTNN